MTSDNVETVERFYRAFQRLDAEAMAECYHPDIRFSDPVFPELRGSKAVAMWTMLCAQAKDFELTFDNIRVTGDAVCGHWEAHYTFSVTGRRVHNSIDTTCWFQDEKIIRHEDRFDFWKWSRMALGPAGLLLGWSPFLRKKVASQAAANLEKFVAAKPPN